MKIWWRHYDVTGHTQVFFYSLENWSSFQKQSPLDWSIYKWNLSFRPKLRGPRGHNVRTVYIKLSEEIEKSTYHMTDTVELLNIWLVICIYMLCYFKQSFEHILCNTLSPSIYPLSGPWHVRNDFCQVLHTEISRQIYAINVTKVTFTNVLALTVAALGRLNIRANSPKKSLK